MLRLILFQKWFMMRIINKGGPFIGVQVSFQGTFHLSEVAT